MTAGGAPSPPWRAVTAVLVVAGLALGLAGSSAVVLAAAAPVSATTPASAVAAAGAATTPGGLPPAIDPAAPVVILQELVFLSPAREATRVDEVVQVHNQGTADVASLTLPLPAGSTGVAAQSGVAPGQLQVTGAKAILALPLAAGAEASLGLTYTVPSSASLLLPIGYPTVECSVLVPHGRWRVRAPGFAPSGQVPLGSALTFDRYTSIGLTAGGQAAVRLAPVAALARPLPRLVLGGIAAAMLAIAALRAVRRRSRARARRVTALVDALARLDLAQRATPSEDYPQRRAQLLAELEAADAR